MRGVNKLAVEVLPEDGIFEKAIFFLRPEAYDLPQKDISDNANILLNDISKTKYTDNQRKISRPALLFSGIAVGSAISWAFILLFISV